MAGDAAVLRWLAAEVRRLRRELDALKELMAFDAVKGKEEEVDEGEKRQTGTFKLDPEEEENRAATFKLDPATLDGEEKKKKTGTFKLDPAASPFTPSRLDEEENKKKKMVNFDFFELAAALNPRSDSEELGTGWPQFFLKPEKKKKKDMGEKKKDSKDMKRIDYSKWDKFADMASNTDSEEERERLAGGTTNYSKSLRDFLEKEGAKDWEQVSAERLKSEGNGLVQSKKYEDALGKYTKALEHLCGRTGGEISTLQVALHNNAALCHLKAGNFTAALTACESARRIDPKNFKALLRHGQASAGLGAFLDAYCDFREAAELEPGDRAVAAELARVRKQLKEQGLEDEELEEVLKGYCGWWEEGERL